MAITISKYKYPWDFMNPGDSFRVEDRSHYHMAQVCSKVNLTNRLKGREQRYHARRDPDDPDCARVWRDDQGNTTPRVVINPDTNSGYYKVEPDIPIPRSEMASYKPLREPPVKVPISLLINDIQSFEYIKGKRIPGRIIWPWEHMKVNDSFFIDHYVKPYRHMRQLMTMMNSKDDGRYWHIARTINPREGSRIWRLK